MILGLAALGAAAPAFADLNATMNLAPGAPNPINPGDVTTFRITLTNSNSASTVTGAAFVDTLPVGLLIAPGGVTSYTCTDGSGASAATTGTVSTNNPVSPSNPSTITLAGGTVPIAASGADTGDCDIDVQVMSYSTNNAYTNTIPVNAVSGTDNTGTVRNASVAQQSVTLNSFSLPTITKGFSASTIVRSDQTVRMTVTINNTNSLANLPLNDATDTTPYSLNDTFPAGLQVAATPNAAISCTGAGVAPAFVTTPVAGATAIQLVGGTVAAGGSCNVQIDLVGNANAYTNSITNTVRRNFDFFNKRHLVPLADATATLTIRSVLQVGKTFQQTTISAGQTASLVITLTNASPINALPLATTNTFTDDRIDGLPGGTTYGLRVFGTPTTTCAGATVAATAGNTGVTLTGGSIPAASSCTITVPYQGSLQTAGTPQSFTNTIATGAVHAQDTTIESNPASHSVTVVDQLTVDKGVSPTTVAPGNPIKYTITVNNYSPSVLTSVPVLDPMQSGLVALASPAPTLTPACGTLGVNLADTSNPRFTIPTIPVGNAPLPGSCTVVFWAMAPLGANVTLNNVIPAGGAGTGGVVNHNQSTTVTTTTAATAVTIGKSFNPSTAAEGTVSLLTITLTNLTAQAVTGAAFTDTLPVGDTSLQLRIADPASASTTCANATLTAPAGGTSISLTGATIPARDTAGTGNYGTCVVQVKVVGAAGNYNNTLAAGALTGTQTYANGTTAPAVSQNSTVSASLSYSSALSSAKTFSPTSIAPGGHSTVSIKLANTNTAGTLNNVSAIDPLPANLTIAATPNAYSTCGGSPVISASAGASTASISGVVLPPSGLCYFLFDVTGTGGANWVNTIPVGNVTATGGVQNVSPITATLTNNSGGGITVTNGTSPNNLSSLGQSSVLTVTLTNGATALTGVGLANYFTDTGLPGGVPTGMQIAATPNLATNCPAGVVSGAAGGTSVILSGATLAANASCTITVNVTLTTTGTVQDQIPVGRITDNEGITNTLATVTSLSAGANIGVIKQFTPAVVKPGDRARLRLTFVNPVALALSNLAATDNLPAGLTVPAGPNPLTTCTGATVAAPTTTQVAVSGGSLPAATGGTSATCYSEIDVVAATAGAYNNVVAVGGVTGTVGGNPVSNPTTATATLQVRTPVTIAKAFSPSSVKLGVVSTATITFTNPNAIALTGAVLTDNLPANLTVAPTPNASTTCASGVVTANASAISTSITGATLPANGSCTMSFDVVSNIAGVYVNTIPAGGLATAQGVTNENPASATLSLLDPPTVNKQFVPVSIAANGTSMLTIVLGNTNATPATLTADLIDTLPTSPGNITIASPNGLSTTCTLASVTATAGSGQVKYASGASIPAGGCSISVNVTGSVVGTYNNFIAVNSLKTNIGNNVQPASANLAISPLGYISGRVFKDNNLVPNGIYDGTDVAIAGVAINLSGTSYGADGLPGGGDDAPVSLSTATDALGNYSFTGLTPGSYTVTEPAQPNGTVNGITTAGAVSGPGGGTPGTATIVSVTPSVISNIILLKDVSGTVSTSPGNNFAEVVNSSISGTVFLDQNNNGVQNLADTALANVTVQLLNSSSVVVATTVTDANGAYSFTNLAPGAYSVLEPTQPAGTINGITTPGAVGNGGSAGTATAPAVTPSKISNIQLPPATASTGNNFAELPSGRQISGRVFGDVNNDGIFNTTDSGLAGVVLNLTGTDINGSPVTATTTTGADGRYVFTGLPEGTFIVTEPSQPARTANGITTAGSTGGTATAVGVVPSVISAINLTGSNSVSADNNFAEILLAVGTVSGKVYIDTNNNGVIDSGEAGIPGVTVILTGTDVNGGAVSLSVVTAADGSYTFPNLQPSNAAGYVITETQPSLYKDGKTAIAAGNPGTAISTKPILSSNTDVIRGVTVIAGDALTNYNFGELGQLTLVPPIVNGYVYLDRDHSRVRPPDGTASGLGGWTVQLSQNGTTICTVTTDENGFYQFDNLHCPGYEAGLPTGTGFAIRFSKDGNNLPAVPTSGGNRGAITPTGGMITGITLNPGDQVVEQNLPLDPSGVVYNSVTRAPVAGAIVAITGPAGFDPAVNLVGGTAAATQTTGADGFYQFLLQNTFPSGVYTLTITAPGGFQAAPSTSLPACNGTLNVGPTPDPALVEAGNNAPGLSVPAQTNPGACIGLVPGGANSTQYYLSFFITRGGSAPILNNHIPLDPLQIGAILVTKTSPMVNVTRGDLVPYTITATNTLTAAVLGVSVRDQIPAGFKYRTGSASLNGVPVTPVVNGRILTMPNQNFVAKERKVYRLILTVGAGVGEGNYVNQAWALNTIAGTMVSNLATATVRVVPDPTFDCPDVIGKVFDDQNANGYQDDGEPGIPSVRVVTPRGLLVTTDAEGRFHVPCPDIPNEDRGSNFVMKLDDRTLPTGYRVTTENPRDVRLTRGKVVKLNFGATIHRVVRLELSDAAFTAGTDTLQPQWQKQVDALPEQLKLKPSVVRLSYQPGTDNPDLVKKRIEALRRQIHDQWTGQKGQYTLNIETEDAP